jgi:hypothetical protein
MRSPPTISFFILCFNRLPAALTSSVQTSSSCRSLLLRLILTTSCSQIRAFSSIGLGDLGHVLYLPRISFVEVTSPVCTSFLFNKVITSLSLLNACPSRYTLTSFSGTRSRGTCTSRSGACFRAGALGLVLADLSQASDHLFHLREVVLSEHVFLPYALLFYTFVRAVPI